MSPGVPDNTLLAAAAAGSLAVRGGARRRSSPSSGDTPPLRSSTHTGAIIGKLNAFSTAAARFEPREGTPPRRSNGDLSRGGYPHHFSSTKENQSPQQLRGGLTLPGVSQGHCPAILTPLRQLGPVWPVARAGRTPPEGIKKHSPWSQPYRAHLDYNCQATQ